MSIKQDIRNRIKDAIRHYDFEEGISNAMDEIDIEEIITKRLKKELKIWTLSRWCRG